MSNNKLFSYEKDAKLIVNGIDDESKAILERFYSIYSVDSRPGVCTPIRKVCSLTKKNSFTKLTYNDFEELTSNVPKTQVFHIKSLFKYLYVYELLNDESGFENCYWNKEELRKKFERRIQNNTQHIKGNDNTKQNSKNYLSFEDMEKLFNFYDSVQDDDEENMKLLFSFMLSFT